MLRKIQHTFFFLLNELQTPKPKYDCEIETEQIDTLVMKVMIVIMVKEELRII